MKRQVLLTDFDRTLIYLYKDESLLLHLAQRICDHYGASLAVETQYRSMDGYHAWHRLHQLCEGNMGAAAGPINDAAEQIVTSFEKEILEGIALIDGVVDTLKQLKEAGIVLGIVSNNASEAIAQVLRRDDVLDLFDVIVGRPVPFRPQLAKPSPYMILQAISRLDAQGAEIYYCGDDVTDMMSANRAGVTAIGVSTGRHSSLQLREAGASLCLEEFQQLPRFLRKEA